MTDTKPTIDEQIAFEKKILPIAVGGMHQAILASLERLKAIDAVQVPDEPDVMTKTFMRGRTMEEHEVVFKHDYDTLRDLLKRIVMGELK